MNILQYLLGRRPLVLLGLTLAALHPISSAGDDTYVLQYEIGLSDKPLVSKIYLGWQVGSAFSALAAQGEREFIRIPIYSTDREVSSVFGQRRTASISSWQPPAAPSTTSSGNRHVPAGYGRFDQGVDNNPITRSIGGGMTGFRPSLLRQTGQNGHRGCGIQWSALSAVQHLGGLRVGGPGGTRCTPSATYPTYLR